MLDHPFKYANSVIETIKHHGFSAYFVGGCVRDYLLNIEVNDIDIATSASPEEIKKIFPKVIPVGIDHGTVIVRYNHISYEVTTYKSDDSFTNKNSQISIKDDLSKRDFTINALAMDDLGEIIDLFNGELDIKKKLIKTVGCPQDRFQEDPLRIIRALRFSSQFGFNIEEKTLQKMKSLKTTLSNLSIERITKEMIKFFTGNNINQGLHYLFTTQIYTELPIFKNNQTLINSLPKDIKPFTRFSEVISYFHLIDENISINQWVKAWKASNLVKSETVNLVASIKNYENNGMNVVLLYKLNRNLIQSFILVLNLYYHIEVKYEAILAEKNNLIIDSRKELAIDGNDITNLFPHLKKGKWIEELMKEIEKEVLYKRVDNNKNTIKEWIKCNRIEIN